MRTQQKTLQLIPLYLEMLCVLPNLLETIQNPSYHVGVSMASPILRTERSIQALSGPSMSRVKVNFKFFT